MAEPTRDPEANERSPLRLADPEAGIRAVTAAKGGHDAGMAADDRAADEHDPVDGLGQRAVFAVVARGAGSLEMPTFPAEEGGSAVAVFTDRGKAVGYLQSARWQETHEVADLSAETLAELPRSAAGQGVTLVLVNPDRRGHTEGRPQYAVDLSDGGEITPESVFRQVHSLADA